MFNFRRITLFCLEKRLSKHKITIFSTNLGGGMSPLALPWLRLCFGPPLGNFLRTPLACRAYFAVADSTPLVPVSTLEKTPSSSHCPLLIYCFFKENVRYVVWTCRHPKNFRYSHFVILIAVSVQSFPLIIFCNCRDANRVPKHL